MSKPPGVRALAFGGCGLNNPLAILYKKKQASLLFRDMGFRRTPYALSSTAAVQLYDFLTLRRIVPAALRHLCYGDPHHVPSRKQAGIVRECHVALVEMSTPIDLVYQDVVLNSNRFDEYVVDPLKKHETLAKLVSRWRQGLIAQNETLRAEAAAALLSALPTGTDAEMQLHDIVRDTRSRRLTVDRMVSDLDSIRQQCKLPMAMIHHNFQYMPDGRPVSWPADFKEQSLEVARRLGVPALDFASLVAEQGTAKVMAADFRHWNPDFYPEIADYLLRFVNSVLHDKLSDKAVAALAPDADLAATLDDPLELEGSDTEAPALPIVTYDHRTGSNFSFDPELLHMVIVLGQSWATGANADIEGDVPATPKPEHPDHALMFDSGAAPRGRPVSALVDLYERAAASMKETPCSGMADQIMRNCMQRFGKKPRMIFTCIGRGGTTLAGVAQQPGDGLLRGSEQHAETMRLVQAAVEMAGRDGQRVRVLSICLAHGESDWGYKTPQREYERGLNLLQQAYDADIRSMTRQTEFVPLLTYQTNKGGARIGIPATIALAQLHAGDANALIRCVGPVYCNEPEVKQGMRGTHLKARGYRRVGQQFGRYIMDDVLGRGRDPLRVLDCRWVGIGRIHLTYPRPLEIERTDDIIKVSTLGPGLGFDFVDGTSAAPTIAQVSVLDSRPDKIEIKLTAHPKGRQPRLFVASRGTGEMSAGRYESPRSGIRSREPFDVDPSDNCPLYDWACSEVVEVR